MSSESKTTKFFDFGSKQGYNKRDSTLEEH